MVDKVILKIGGIALTVYDSRRAAFREAKRQNKIPVASQPKETIRPETDRGDEMRLDKIRNVRLFIFDLEISTIDTSQNKEVYIREDKEAFYGSIDGEGDQLPHFNAGTPPKLKGHYYRIDGKDKNK